MPDQLATSAGAAAASPEPGTVSPEIEKIKTELASAFTAQINERVGGLQRVIAGKDETIKALGKELEEFKTAGLSEDEREQLQSRQLREENERLQSQLELERLGKDYGAELPIFQELLAASSAKDQLEMLRKLRTPAAPVEQAPAAPAAPAVPDVDPNNPMRSAPTGVVLPDGRLMTDELADQILRSVDRQADVTQRNMPKVTA
jgi:hypothetical protein